MDPQELRAPVAWYARGMLKIELHCARDRYREGEDPELRAAYTNLGDGPLALAFWWHRTLRVRDHAGRLVVPGPGRELPCGVPELLEVLPPGTTHERVEVLACTQPAGHPAHVGWSYALAPGSYRLSLVFEAPPAHGFTQHAPDPHEFVGRVESNEVSIAIVPRRG
jgi:hypothetical protein